MGDKQYKTNSYTNFFYYAFRNILFIFLPLVVIFAVILSIPRSIAADGSAVDKVVLALPSSCTLTSEVDLEHNAIILNGVYKKDIGQTSLGTFCNDENGYVVYAIGATNGEDGNTVLASSVSLPNSSVGDSGNYDIATGLAENGDTSNWAMKLGYKTGDASTTPPVIEANYENKYALIPNDWAKVVSKQAGTTDMNKGSNFTTTYAVYTSPTQPAGAYTGQVKFTLFHPSSSTKPTTLAQAYKNAGKQKIEITDPITGETGSFYKMQDMTTAICNATNVTGEASQTQLVDIRDNKLYWATKLLDGHCWMTQNLDLDLKDTVTYTHSDTDLGWTDNDIDMTWDLLEGRSTIVFDGVKQSSVPGWVGDDYTPYSADPGDIYVREPEGRVYSSLNDCVNDTHNAGGCHHLKVGNYYNWSAAVANNNTNIVDLKTQYNNAHDSICPAGWKLPLARDKYDTVRSFGNLLMEYDVITTFTSTVYKGDGFYMLSGEPLHFIRSGFVMSDLGGQGYLSGLAVYGSYYSSTVGNLYSAFGMRHSSNYINTALMNGDFDRRRGMTIRCVAR